MKNLLLIFILMNNKWSVKKKFFSFNQVLKFNSIALLKLYDIVINYYKNSEFRYFLIYNKIFFSKYFCWYKKEI